MRRLLPLAVLALVCPAPLSAQTVGQKIPPYQPPAKAASPTRGQPTATLDTGVASTDAFLPREDSMARFAAAYTKAGKPRLAFYWNRQLAEVLGQWYGDQRTVITRKSSGNAEGDVSLKSSADRQSTVETQRRVGTDGAERPGRGESWDWEFQDGFLQPFFQTGAQVVDRTAILRIMGAGAEEIPPQTVEVMAIQTMADLLVEVLVADQPQSTTGYELRARILDVKTGQILALVNSRALKEWQRSQKAVATAKGFEISDEDGEGFGPERAGQGYKATSTGFEKRRPPPKPAVIAHNLATNVMDALIPRLEAGAPPPPKTVMPLRPDRPNQAESPEKPAATAPESARPMDLTKAAPPAPAKSKAPINDSAVPLPDVETKPLPPPQKTTATPARPSPTPDEPPMPKPTRE